MELLGGQINLQSSESEGSIFSFTISVPYEEDKLPLEDCFDLRSLHTEFELCEITSLAKEPVIEEEQIIGNSLPHLLLVEDNIIALRLIESIAKQAGCQITSATDGEQALKLALSMSFDLIITDIGLPGLSGNELTERLRAVEKSTNKAAIPIIGLTAHALAIAEKQCLSAGMNQVFTKPINLATMKKIIAQFSAPNTNDEQREMHSLGSDLPNTEKQLFELSQFPLLSVGDGISNLGSIDLLTDLLTLLLKEALPEDELILKTAFEENDWEQIENLAHKMKSGALYCGTIKLKFACQYLEHYLKTGYHQQLEPLYQQLMTVIQLTKEAIEEWLEQ